MRRKVEALQNEIRDKSREFYGLSWIDVPEAFEEESKNKIPVLDEVRDKAVKNADGKPTHILIEGDNYHALTCLNYTHRGKIDVIYIDPPYNTGNDGFTYKDARFLTKFPDGTKIDKNHPLRHSSWLSFMAKRLELAKNLLSEKGVIFISIDDNEQANLKLLCDRIFGEENFVATIPWRKRTAKADVPYNFSQDCEWVVCYANAKFKAGIKKESRKYYETEDLPNRPWRVHDLTKQTSAEERPKSFFTIVNPKNGKEYPANPKRTWAITIETFQEYYAKDRIVFPGDYDFLKILRPVLRYFKEDDERKAGALFGFAAVSTDLPKTVGMTQDGTQDLNKIFDEKLFSFPKPVSLISYLLQIATPLAEKITILDFFAGSGTTMHATMKLNAEDGGKRQCILVTNNENQICEKVTYERNRRVMCGYVNSKGENVAGIGNSMKYYRTAFVGGNDAKNARDRDRRELSRKAGALLSLAENTLEELSVPEAEAAYFQIFSDGKYRFTAVYFALDWTHLDALAGTLKTLSAQTRGKARFAIYVYCDGAPDIFEDDLADVPGATLKAIPQPILEIYKTINGGK